MEALPVRYTFLIICFALFTVWHFLPTSQTETHLTTLGTSDVPNQLTNSLDFNLTSSNSNEYLRPVPVCRVWALHSLVLSPLARYLNRSVIFRGSLPHQISCQDCELFNSSGDYSDSHFRHHSSNPLVITYLFPYSRHLY